MSSQKYYWLKLSESFFDDLTIKMIEEMDNGIYYTNFLLKLYLKSVRTDGKLMFREVIPYDVKMLSILTGVNIDVVRGAMAVFEELKLVERWSDGTLYISEMQKMIGTETDVAKRVRKHREQKKEIALKEIKERTITISEKTVEKKPSQKSPFDKDGFERFWEIYCKKSDRKKCEKLWQKITAEQKEKIFLTLPKYVDNSFLDGSFPMRKNPSTYLNGECWNDEVIEVSKSTGTRRKVSEFKETVTLKKLEM